MVTVCVLNVSFLFHFDILCAKTLLILSVVHCTRIFDHQTLQWLDGWLASLRSLNGWCVVVQSKTNKSNKVLQYWNENMFYANMVEIWNSTKKFSIIIFAWSVEKSIQKNFYKQNFNFNRELNKRTEKTQKSFSMQDSIFFSLWIFTANCYLLPYSRDSVCAWNMDSSWVDTICYMNNIFCT